MVACGALDILESHVDSVYFFYDTDYKWLNLGVIGALKEIEYMQKLRIDQRYKWYVLGDMVISCPKVNYKLQYQPGYIPCPRTKKEIPISKV